MILGKRLLDKGLLPSTRLLVLISSIIFIFCTSAFAQTVTVTTDKPDYPPGDSVIINGYGFLGNETVEVQVIHDDGTPPGGLGHDPWNVVADSNGDFETYWIIPDDDNVDEVLRVTATGLTSGWSAFTTFTDANTILTVTQNFPEICMDTIDASTTYEVCATLEQHCSGENQPLPNRLILFFINAGDCGVNQGQIAFGSAMTNENGEACLTVTRLDTLLNIGDNSLRPKFLGEEKPDENAIPPDPPNGACSDNEYTKLSSSNDCEAFEVTQTCEIPCEVTITCPSDVTISCEDDSSPTNTGEATYTFTGNTCGTLTVSYSDVVTPGVCANEETITRTWQVIEDGTTVMASCTQTIYVVDNTDPTLAGCPTDITVECDAIPAPADVTASDNCPGVTLDYSQVKSDIICANSYTLTRTWVATDACGNTATCIQVITVVDTEAPAFVEECPTDVTVECDAIPTAPTMTATDNCTEGIITATFDETTTPGTCANSYTLTRTWTATDECDNSDECVQVITVVDTQAPVFVEECPIDVTVECDAIPTAPTMTATDNCTEGIITATFDETTTTGACANSYTLTRVWTATDECDNSETCTQVITVVDTEAPVFVEECPTDVTVECDAIPTAPTMTATDNCTTVITVNYNETMTPGVNSYTLTRTWTAIDECDNSVECVQVITVVDTEAPVFDQECPTDVTVECDAVPTAPTLTATDNCTENIVVSYSETTIDGNCANNYTLTRVWTATDESDNSISCTQVITVQDTQAPVFNSACPTDLTLECGSDVPAADVLTASDNCTEVIVVNFDEITTPGQCVNEYVVTRTWTATDECENTATCVQTITVQDTQAPVFDQACPTNVTVECDAIPTAPTMTATDNCTANIDVQFAEETTPGQCLDSYTITRTWTATDECNNSVECVQVITVEDSTPPVFNEGCPEEFLTVECDAVPDPAVLTATDNCAGSVEVIFTETVLRTPPVDCEFNYALERHWTATDNCGNTAECVQTVFVEDTTPPEFVETCPVDINAECDNVPEEAVLTATDNCDQDVVVTYAEVTTPGQCDNAYTITRTWTATDDCENTTTCTQVVTVDDNTNPVCTVPDNFEVFMCTSEEVCRPVGCTDNCDLDPTISVVNGPGQIINGEWCYTPTSSGTVNVTIRCDDDCGNFCESSFSATFTFNSPPVVSCPDESYRFLCNDELVPQCIPGFSITDPDANIASIIVEGGTLVDDNTVCVDPVEGVHTVIVTATDECGLVSSCTTTVEIEINDPPQVGCPPDYTMHWQDSYATDISATDPNSSQTLTYSLGSGSPAGMEINSSTGVITWTPDNNYNCLNTVEVIVTDDCDISDNCTFEICLTNTPPQVTCPSETISACVGSTVEGSIESVSDPDNGPNALTYSVASFDGPGEVIINSQTGDWEWVTYDDGSYTGHFELCIEVSDQAPICECNFINADTCCVDIYITPVRYVYIEKTHNTYQGQVEYVSIYFDSTIAGSNDMGGFDFLIQYDASVLLFMSAEQGEFLTNCNWEYFTYRYGENGNCDGNACPSGIVRIVGIAETNDGGNHPDCDGNTSGHLAELSFLVTNDRTAECMYAPIRWIWYDCGDNSISSTTGEILFISRYVYEWEDFDGLNSIADHDELFPSIYGANASCDSSIVGKPTTSRCGIDFWNGGIDIVCADSIDARGDINLNDLVNEISDAVLFSNYFVYGISVFDINEAGQIAASDVNADGLTLSVADLVYLVRIIIGDASPYPKEVVPANIKVKHQTSGLINLPTDVKIGAAHFVVEGDVTPVLKATNMEMIYNFDGINTRILVYSLKGNSCSGDMVEIDGKILSTDMADVNGLPLAAKIIPAHYQLMQNYPNPFNPTTIISFLMPNRADYKLTIFNVRGQKVALFEGTQDAGQVDITWDASDMASGIYFYRLDVDNISDTKKMLLLK